MNAFRNLALSDLHESALNPRKSFDKERLAELTESVKAKGILQPIVARPNADGFEIVCGARRYRAAKAAGLTEIPTIVRDLNDQEVLEIAVIENLQRADVHPLEEAEGYEQLIAKHGYLAENLAAKVGKSKAYIYGRLKLCALGPKGRKQMYEGTLDASTALLIARIPVIELQDEAIDKLAEAREYGDVSSYRDAAAFLHDEYMLRLKDAPFDVKTIYFYPKNATPIGTPCGECPKRTGNQPELFADVQGADVCTDPVCFKAKREAHAAILVAKAKDAGKDVITGKAAKKALPNEHGSLVGYVSPNTVCYEDSKNRTYKAVFGEALKPLQLLQNPHTGEVIEVIASDVVKALVAAKFPKVKAAGASVDRYQDEQRKKEAKAKLETQVREQCFAAVCEKHPGAMTPIEAALIAGAMFDRASHDEKKRLLQLHDPEGAVQMKDDVWKHAKAFAKTIPTLAPKDLVLLMVQLALIGEVHVNTYQMQPADNLFDLALRCGADPAKIRAEFTRVAKEKAKPKAKPPAKKPAKVA